MMSSNAALQCRVLMLLLLMLVLVLMPAPCRGSSAALDARMLYEHATGDPYRIAFPLALFHLPVTLPFLRAWLPPRVLYALSRARLHHLDADVERDAQLLVRVVVDRVTQAARAPQAQSHVSSAPVAGDPRFDAFRDPTNTPVVAHDAQPPVIPEFAPPALDIAMLHRLPFPVDTLECYVIVHDRLSESPVMATTQQDGADVKHDDMDAALAVAMAESTSGAEDDTSTHVADTTPLYPYDLNLIAHPWLFRHLRCEQGVAVVQPLIMGVFACDNVMYAGDARVDPLEARVVEMMVRRGAWHVTCVASAFCVRIWVNDWLCCAAALDLPCDATSHVCRVFAIITPLC